MKTTLHFLTLGCLFMFLPSLPAASPIRSVPTDQPVVALTFDDGPHATQTALLLELLARENVRVTFFEIAVKVAQHPEIARAIVAAGHEIGNHSKTHANLAELADLEAVRAEPTGRPVAKRSTTFRLRAASKPAFTPTTGAWPPALCLNSIPSPPGDNSRWPSRPTCENTIRSTS